MDEFWYSKMVILLVTMPLWMYTSRSLLAICSLPQHPPTDEGTMMTMSGNDNDNNRGSNNDTYSMWTKAATAVTMTRAATPLT